MIVSGDNVPLELGAEIPFAALNEMFRTIV